MTIQASNYSLIEAVQRNCDISDARDHGVYSMCSMVLKLRNLYKWEQGVEPWEEPEPADLLDWIESKETFWENLVDTPYEKLPVAQEVIAEFESEKINPTLTSDNIFYGAGYGRSLKSIFFLAEILEQTTVEGCNVVVLGKELAKEMASPFALVQSGTIIIRRESLRYFLWDQIQEMRSSCRSSFSYFLEAYDLRGASDKKGDLNQDHFKNVLETMVDREMNLFIYHEVGEILQREFSTSMFQAIIARFPTSLMEFVCRALKDVLADTHSQGTLGYIIKNELDTTLSLYVTMLDGIRETLFSDILEGWKHFIDSKNFDHIETVRQQGWTKCMALTKQIETIYQNSWQLSDEQVLTEFESKVLIPLELQVSTQKKQSQ